MSGASSGDMAPAARMSNPADFRATAMSGTRSGVPVTRAVGKGETSLSWGAEVAVSAFHGTGRFWEAAGSPGRHRQGVDVPLGAERQSTTGNGNPRG